MDSLGDIDSFASYSYFSINRLRVASEREGMCTLPCGRTLLTGSIEGGRTREAKSVASYQFRRFVNACTAISVKGMYCIILQFTQKFPFCVLIFATQVSYSVLLL